MDREREFLSAVGACYRGAVDPALWTLGLDGVSRSFDGAFSVVEIRRRDRPEVFIETSTVDLSPKAHQDYNAHWGVICPRAAMLGELPDGGVMHDDQIGDEAALDRHEYYTDFLAPQGLRYFLACKVEALSNIDVVISVQRPRDAGRADAGDIERFARLAPHLSSAYALRLAFGRHLTRANSLDRVADMLDAAVLLVDAGGRALYVSRAAETMLAAAPGLSLTRDGLIASGDEGRHIGRLIQQAAQGVPRAGGILEVLDAGLRLRIAPLHEDADIPSLARAAAVVIVERLGSGTEYAFLKPRFGLTEREIEMVADLCGGRSPREIAEARNLKLSTVRTHIARAREKMAARSIIDLVRIALSRPPK
ncbi:MAG: helix-turn-helix transcriptional regulator [Rhizobiaceae bacterium]